MKKAFIVYFEDKSAVVVIATDAHNAVGSIDFARMKSITRVEVIPFEVL